MSRKRRRCRQDWLDGDKCWDGGWQKDHNKIERKGLRESCYDVLLGDKNSILSKSRKAELELAVKFKEDDSFINNDQGRKIWNEHL